MQPDVECRISDQLFENPSPLTEVRVEQAIRHTLDIYEKRIEVIDILINSDNDKNRLDVTVAFRIRNTEQIIEVPVRLERIR
jgi:phage baseplate assembly protein W